VNQRTVLEHRIGTLEGLLAAPGGPLGPNAGPLGDRLRGDWLAELRLLQRLLAETPGDDVRPTIGQWRDRTRAFAARGATAGASWSDKQGNEWSADTVLRLLDETEDRVDRWLRTTSPADTGAANDAGTGAQASPAQEV